MSLRSLAISAVVVASLAVSAAGVVIVLLQFRPPQDALHFSREAVLAVADDLEWRAIGGDQGMQRYSPLAQIASGNVGLLEEAWQYSTGEAVRRGSVIQYAKFQATPILAAGNLILCTPFNRVIALDPATGQERWVFDADLDTSRPPANHFNCRGLAQWRDSGADESAACGHRVFMATNDRRLIALDARSGASCAGFGDMGEVTVVARDGLASAGEVQIVAAPAIAGDVVIVGSSVADNFRANAPSGAVRAFDARTGRPRWTFDPTPGSGERTGGANVWSSITVDTETGIVYLPTSSPSPDFYGGERSGDAGFANAIVALRADTGALVWRFQVVHHDLWDYDIPAGPSLFLLRREGRDVPALAFSTKQGFLFVLDRRTGEPLYPVVETPTPASDIEGERASPTQPFSTLPILAPQSVRPENAFGLTPLDRAACESALQRHRNEGLFTPPSLRGTVLAPTTGGGANWGGVAIDPESNRLIVNTSRAAEIITLVPRAANHARIGGAAEGSASVLNSRFDVRREVLLSPLGLPCTKPPWGALTAIDLDTGTRAWEVTLGTTSTLAPLGIAMPWGTPNLGGALVTGGGLVFIGAAMDNRLRAFSLNTGQALWAADLPAGGQASPMTYAVGGRQYVVIAAGGHSVLDTKRGDSLVAFALPDKMIER